MSEEFKRNLAVIIGINRYQNGVQPLTTATQDARKLGEILQTHYHYQLIQPSLTKDEAILDEAATLQQLRLLLTETLPKQIKPNKGDRLLIYFAGHGITRQVNEQGPQGFLVPQDADISNPDSLLPMSELYQALDQLECRHLLVILDCCFAGMFRWANTRKVVLVPDTIHWEHYYRFIKYPAWQVITSAAHNQEALDCLDNRSTDPDSQHSPFAQALFEGLLAQKADLIPDGVITTAELYLYLRDYVEKYSKEQQTPGFWPLSKHDRGEYIFQIVPSDQLKLKSAPKLEKDNNPYRGLEAYEEKHSKLFFGRNSVIEDLVEYISRPHHQFTVVDGVSGSGKSSLVKSGLLSILKADAKYRDKWHVFSPMRPGPDPFLALVRTLLPADTSEADISQAREDFKIFPETLQIIVDAWINRHPGKTLLLVIDQFEELITLAPQAASLKSVQWGRRFNLDHLVPKHELCAQWLLFIGYLAEALDACPQLHLLVTLRSDFAPRFQTSALGDRWAEARFSVRPMRSDELRETVLGPANEMALYFEPAKLVDRLVDEVAQMPAALPLLSFTLSELYLKLHSDWVKEGKSERALSVEASFDGQGGVAGLLANRANEEYAQLPDDAHRKTMRRVMLRMVNIEGTEAVKRRVQKTELLYVDAKENDRVEYVLSVLDQARLIVAGEEAGEPYVEPAHDFLVRGWDRLQDWIEAEQETLLLQRLLIPATRNWQKTKRDLWNGNSRLSLLKQIKKSKNSWLNQLEVLFVQRSLLRKRLNIGLRLSFFGLVLGIGGLSWIVSEEAIEFLTAQIDRLDKVVEERTRELDETARNLTRAKVSEDQSIKVAARAEQSEEQAREQAKEAKENAETASEEAALANRTAKREVIKQYASTAEALGNPIEAMLYAINAVSISQDNSLWDEPPSQVPVSLMTSIEKSRELTVLSMPAEENDGVPSETVSPVEEGESEEATVEVTDRAFQEGAQAQAALLAIAPNSQTIITGDRTGTLAIWNRQEPSPKPKNMDGTIRDLLPVSENQIFAWIQTDAEDTLQKLNYPVADSDGVEDIANTEAISLRDNDRSPTSIAVASNAGSIAAGYSNGDVKLIDAQGNESPLLPDAGLEEAKLTEVAHVSLSPNGEKLILIRKDSDTDTSQLQLWSKETSDSNTAWESVELENELSEKYPAIEQVEFSTDGNVITVVGQDDDDKSVLEFLNAEDGTRLLTKPVEISDEVKSLTMTDAKEAFVVGSEKAYLWDSQGRLLLEDDLPAGTIFGAIAPDGKEIVFSTTASKIHVWKGIRHPIVNLYHPLPEVEVSQPVAEVTVETEAAETKAAETKAAETKAAETETAETETAETETAETETADQSQSATEVPITEVPITIEKNEEGIAPPEPVVETVDNAEADLVEAEAEPLEEDSTGSEEPSQETSQAQATLESELVNDTEIAETEKPAIQAVTNRATCESSLPATLIGTLSAQNDICRMFMAVSPGGETVVSVVNTLEGSAQPAQIETWSKAPNDPLTKQKSIKKSIKGIKGVVKAVSISKEGRRIALLIRGSKETEHYVKVWDRDSESFLENPISLKLENPISLKGDYRRIFIQLTPEGRHLIVGTTLKIESIGNREKISSALRVWDVDSQTKTPKNIEDIPLQPIPNQEITAITVSPDGETLMTASRPSSKQNRTSRCRAFDGISRLQAGKLQANESMATATLEATDTLVLIPGYVSAIALAQIEPTQTAQTEQTSTKQTLAALSLTNANKLTKRSKNNLKGSNYLKIRSTVQLWTVETDRLVEEDRLVSNNILGRFLAFMPDGKNVFVGGEKVLYSDDSSAQGNSSAQGSCDRDITLQPTVELLSKTNQQAILQPTLSEKAGQLNTLAITPDGQSLFAGIHQEREIGSIVWDFTSNGLLDKGCQQLKQHPYFEASNNIDFGPETKKICDEVLENAQEADEG